MDEQLQISEELEQISVAKSLVHTLSLAVQTHTKSMVVPSSKRIKKPWITPGLLRCMRNRDKLYRKTKKEPNNETLNVTYKRYKNFCNNLLKKLKKEYESSEFLKRKKKS